MNRDEVPHGGSQGEPHDWVNDIGSPVPSRGWLGFPRFLPAHLAQRHLVDLRRVWLAQTSEEPGDLVADLGRLRKWFDPMARGSSLRKALEEVKRLKAGREQPGEPFVLQVDNDRFLVSPEGRVLMELLRRALAERSDTVSIPLAGIAEAESVLLETYRNWAQRRLRDVISLLTGRAPALLPQALGQILFLLLNGSVGASRAVSVPRDPRQRERMDEAIGEVVEAFADTLVPPLPSRRRNRAHYSLYSGYALTEGRRRLGRLLVVDEKGVYLREGSEADVLARIREEVQRRGPEAIQRFPLAFDAMAEAYATVRPLLASRRIAFSRPAQTASLRQRLLKATP